MKINWKINSADLAEMLKTEQDMATYLTLVIEEGDVSELSHALGIAARAAGDASAPPLPQN